MPRVTRQFHLADPVKHGDQEIETLTLTTPNLGEMMELDKAGEGDVAKSIQTISVLTALPPSVIKQLMPWDVEAMQAVIAEVMNKSDPERLEGRGGNGSLPIPLASQRNKSA